MPFQVSAPLLDLIVASGAAPERVNAVVNRRLDRGEDSRMRCHEHYPRLMRERTGMNVVGLCRANRCLLLRIESQQPLWRYTEESRNRCLLAVVATIPDTLRLALVGRPARSLALTASILDDLPIDSLEQDGAWTVAVLRPTWRRF